jgi:hypothetical protein
VDPIRIRRVFFAESVSEKKGSDSDTDSDPDTVNKLETYDRDKENLFFVKALRGPILKVFEAEY